MNRTAKTLLVAALVAVVGMAFSVSWNALRDVARVIGLNDTTSGIYPFVVDGLMALALVAALVLTGADRRFALRVLAAYTIASLVLNYVHGLHGRSSADWVRLAEGDLLNWVLVLLAASLPVGSIYFGSDLVGKVLHHRPQTRSDAEKLAQTDAHRSISDRVESAGDEATPPALAVVAESAPAVEAVPDPVAADADPVTVPVLPTVAVAADRPRSRRATGRVPESARSTRTTRSRDELLAEARALTESWSVKELTADRLRQTLRTSPANGRMLRDVLRAEREQNTAAEVVIAG
ncbi:DUF2637 domain-containing protein [Streptomyces sp. WAC06614]|uniref:DUF2637 domain-containing protein n=1 Tax=Streptomyces sp. WAC06614 TaxID=2487416 RepID=UPI000F76F935|nr:DUF2637 domain-containing protein [Streptomyces sp. WAC06614]RSS79489.1 DUF2637 domain-containing protein [Streptomyces sp. WAC06614]